MKVKLIKSITVNGGKAKKGEILDESPKVVQKLILWGFATADLDKPSETDSSQEAGKDADKPIEWCFF